MGYLRVLDVINFAKASGTRDRVLTIPFPLVHAITQRIESYIRLSLLVV
jgi:hypothetical protein